MQAWKFQVAVAVMVSTTAACGRPMCLALCFAIASAETKWYVAGPVSVTECA